MKYHHSSQSSELLICLLDETSRRKYMMLVFIKILINERERELHIYYQNSALNTPIY